MNELADFVLNAIHQAGGLVDSPAYDTHDVLLPEEVARRWQVPTYQRLTFAHQTVAPGEGEPKAIGYGHPLVETLVDEIRSEPACMQLYLIGLRTDKRGLFALGRKALAFPNARLSKVPNQAEVRAGCHYLHFNFKAALLTDEKQEQLVSVVMDVQAGFAVPELVEIERLAPLQDKAPTGSHLPAPVRWLPGHEPLSGPVLNGLLERATSAALREMAQPLETLHRRATRHLELDRARLNDYYDGIAGDLQRRIERIDPESQDREARRESLEDKLATTQAERVAKLADVEAKYRPRVELELINAQFIHQPKVLLPVRIGSRAVTVERTIVWDPLLHRIEPLACDVCGQAATSLVLCHGKHLVHEKCLLPEQCVDCKRTYCRLCAGQMDHCAVCRRPVCRTSLNRCTECGQDTCREHLGQCHAPPPEPPQAKPPEEPPTPRPSSPPPPAQPKEPKPAPPRSKKPKTKPARKRSSRSARKAPSRPSASKIEVYPEPEVLVVNAFVLTKGNKQIALRSWEWDGEVIKVFCRCEKGFLCPINGKAIEMAEVGGIEAQLRDEIEDLRREYGVSPRRVLYYAMVYGAPKQVPRLTLPSLWKD